MATNDSETFDEGSRMARRSIDDIREISNRIVDVVRKNPGIQASKIKEELGITDKEFPRPLREAVATNALIKHGDKRGATYEVRGGSRTTSTVSYPDSASLIDLTKEVGKARIGLELAQTAMKDCQNRLAEAEVNMNETYGRFKATLPDVPEKAVNLVLQNIIGGFDFSPTPSKGPGLAKTNGRSGLKKADFILSFPRDMSAKEVVEKAKAQGVNITPSYVYVARHNQEKGSATEAPPNKVATKADRSVSNRVLSLLQEHPEGLKFLDIVKELKTNKDAVRDELLAGLETNALSKKGVRRGTTYFLSSSSNKGEPNDFMKKRVIQKALKVIQSFGKEAFTAKELARKMHVPTNNMAYVLNGLRSNKIIDKAPGSGWVTVAKGKGGASASTFS